MNDGSTTTPSLACPYGVRTGLSDRWAAFISMLMMIEAVIRTVVGERRSPNLYKVPPDLAALAFVTLSIRS